MRFSVFQNRHPDDDGLLQGSIKSFHCPLLALLIVNMSIEVNNLSCKS